MTDAPHACSAKAALPRPKPVTVNGVTIARAAIARETQNHPAATPIEAWTRAAHALVLRELLSQEARARGVAAEPLVEGERRETEEEAAVRVLVEQAVATPEPTEDECRRYYHAHRARFRSADLWEAAHILFAAPASDEPARRAAREAAAACAAELRADRRRFPDLAVAHSRCPSAALGGNLGQVTPGSTAPEFEAALRRLAPGEIAAEPVETRFGFHVVRLDRHVSPHDLPFDLVAERIAAYLREAVRRRATAQYLARLVSAAEITGVALPGAAEHRVH